VSDGVHVAYQTWGSGPPLVGVPPFVQNIEQLWQDPTRRYPRFLERFGSFRTITHFDKRGTGLSDRVPGFVSIEERMDDLRAVMDAAGIERSVVGGISEGGPLDRHDRLARHVVEREGGRVVKSTGDGILATFDSPSRAVRAGLALAPAMSDLGIEIRAGLHTGEVELRGDDVSGLAVHAAARVQAAAGAGEVLATSTVRDLVLGSPFAFADRGRHALKGLPGEWQLLGVAAAA
jgi:pimeloyl-ACP methyl ester carboxylesterase